MSDLNDHDQFGRVDFLEPRLPTESEVGASLYNRFTDSTTGIIYTCVDDTFGSQIWHGCDNTLIEKVINPILAYDHPDLFLMYTMDNISGSTVIDETPNLRNGTIGGSVSTPGILGNAMQIPATSSGIALPNKTGTFTTCFWARFTVPGARLFLTNGYMFWNASVFITETTVGTNIVSSAHSVKSASVPYTPVLNEWYFVCGTYSAATGPTITLNDNYNAGTGPASNQRTDGTAMNWRANASETQTIYYSGVQVDQLRIFNRILTQEEQLALYNEGVA